MLLHSSKKHLPPLNVTYNGHPLKQVDEFMLLGVLLDQHLEWNPNVDLIVSRVSQNLRLMRRLSWILLRQVLSAFYYAYLVPSFNYCSLVWRVCQVSDARKLQCLQNFAARIILCEADQSHTDLPIRTRQSPQALQGLCRQLCQRLHCVWAFLSGKFIKYVTIRAHLTLQIDHKPSEWLKCAQASRARFPMTGMLFFGSQSIRVQCSV